VPSWNYSRLEKRSRGNNAYVWRYLNFIFVWLPLLTCIWLPVTLRSHLIWYSIPNNAIPAAKQTHIHIHFMALWTLSMTTQVSWYQKGKSNLDLLEQEIVRGSGISWAICKSAPWPRHITMQASHHFSFCRLDALPVAQTTVSKHWRHQHWRHTNHQTICTRSFFTSLWATANGLHINDGNCQVRKSISKYVTSSEQSKVMHK